MGKGSVTKQGYLLIASTLISALFFVMPWYYYWLTISILQPTIGYKKEFTNLQPAERKMLRYGSAYSVYMQWVSAFNSARVDNPVILLPPAGYLKDMGVEDVADIEPAELYYYTGYKSVYATSPNVGTATWTLVPHKPAVTVRRIQNQKDFTNLLNIYIGYKLSRESIKVDMQVQ